MNVTKLWLYLLLVIGIAGSSTMQAKARDNKKVSKDMENQIQKNKDQAGDPNLLVDVIVQFQQDAEIQNAALVGSKGGESKKDLHIIKAGLFRLPMSRVQELASDPGVAYVSSDRPVAGFLDITAPTVGADVAWNQFGLDGSGVGVAIIDSGIAAHSDLNAANSSTSRVIYSEDLSSAAGTVDQYGHGTHVAGIVGSNGSKSLSGYTGTFRGIAPNANLINLRVLDQNGAGTDSTVIAGIQRAIALKNIYNIRVINLSLGRPVYESYKLDPLCQAVEQAWKAGIIVVAAAGNSGRDNSQGTDGYATIGAPGNDPYVITVGATRSMGTTSRNDDLVATYSSKGPTLFDHVVKPDLIAPGNRIVSLIDAGSTLDVTYPRFETAPLGHTQTAPSYFRLSGTSMAAPVVSGAAALLLQKNPQLTPDQVKARLMKTAWKGFPTTSTGTDPLSSAIFSSQYDVFTIGAGMLDIGAALNNNDLATGLAVSPSAVQDPLTGSISLVYGDSLVWGSSVVWGQSLVWGSSVVWGNTLISGTSVCWGNSVVWGNTTMTGYTLVWGNSLVWGSSTATATFSNANDGEN